MNVLGKQTSGQSTDAIYRMALRAFAHVQVANATVADIGAGQGNLARLLVPDGHSVTLVDDFKPTNLPEKCYWIKADLNEAWNMNSSNFDFIFAIEVIEHLENPRHFFRELVKIMKPGSYGFVSTPNNDSFFSRLNFLLTGQHRFFQDSCYPAHITPILHIDMSRFLNENKLSLINYYYTDEETVPKFDLVVKGKGKLYSKNFGVLFKKQS